MAAFEKGTISDEAFASRVRDLQAKATTLRHRRDQAAATPEDHDLPTPTIGRLRPVHDDLRRAFEWLCYRCRKRVARAFIHELKVDDDNRVIQPLYRLRDCLPDPSNEPQEEADSLTAVRSMGSQVG